MIVGIQMLGVSETVGKLADLPARLNEAERRSVEKVAVRGVGIWKRKASGPVLKVRSDGYRASIDKTPASRGADGALESRVGVRQGLASKYAAIHETGGVIRPQGHPFLTIPLDAAKTKGGDKRTTTPRDYPDGFFFTSKAGNRIFGVRQGAGLIPLFVLKSEVTIPARRPMGQTKDEIAPLMAPTFEAEVRKAVG